ncbi:uncharacterized protein CELE_K08D10.11 [Caenorhabditis elegans]|uniref:Uncharacterized protein n=1 Tax=Caenorhabditis elegans TaxID=6239 RepID=Q21326_CAEEL|nr:Uncharacterized protein CELE_K08D10.11 [Caenorhabditis elegans]CCD72719.2 Uncharacterized protein CELE_K08D10.11 [Caenorhabditis elegans]|eukprot:NP_500508.2 Uncharacterized protein CELE_K08D10.11 [Caenorhabditis elegans]
MHFPKVSIHIDRPPRPPSLSASSSPAPGSARKPYFFSIYSITTNTFINFFISNSWISYKNRIFFS